MPETLDPETASEVMEAPPEPETSPEDNQEVDNSTYGWLKGYYDAAVTAASNSVDGLYYMASDIANSSPTIQNIEGTVVSNLNSLSDSISGLISGTNEESSEGTELQDLPPRN